MEVRARGIRDCTRLRFKLSKRNMEARLGIVTSTMYHSVAEEHREHQNKNTAEVETRPCNMNHEPKPTADNLDLARRMKKLVSVALNLRQFMIRE